MLVKIVLFNIIGRNPVYTFYNSIRMYGWIYGIYHWLVLLTWFHKRFCFEKYFWHRKSLLFWVKKLHFILWYGNIWSYSDMSLKVMRNTVCQISSKNVLSECQKFLAFLFGKYFELRNPLGPLNILILEFQIPKFEDSTLKYTWDITTFVQNLWKIAPKLPDFVWLLY